MMLFAGCKLVKVDFDFPLNSGYSGQFSKTKWN